MTLRDVARKAAQQATVAYYAQHFSERGDFRAFLADAVALDVLREAKKHQNDWNWLDASLNALSPVETPQTTGAEAHRTGFYGGLGGMCQHCGVAFDKHATFCERCGKDIGEGFICVLWKGHTVACCGQRPSAVEPWP
jgi:hypothetical protein